MGTKTFGVSMDEALADEIERPLEYGQSRSERCRKLIELGLEVEESMKDTGTYTPEHDSQIAFVRKAIETHAAQINE